MPAESEDMGSISGSGRSAAEGNGNALQYSCLEDSMDEGSKVGSVRSEKRWTWPSN